MAEPRLSAHFLARQPSSIRVAQIRHSERTDGVGAVNVAIGNVSLPMHPAMIERMRDLGAPQSPFRDGVVKYTGTAGEAETNQAFLNIIASSGFATGGLKTMVTDGGSQAMELVIVGCCGPAGSRERPLLLIDAAYTNYKAFASRLGRATVSMTRTLGEDGQFTLPQCDEIERLVAEHKPGAMIVIPYDNPTGQWYDHESLRRLAEICVRHGLWMVSDEAYRELHYKDAPVTSIWGITEREVPGIEGRRISIETASKIWNACGLRIGALVTDSAEFQKRAVAEKTASLCSSAIGQWIFAALAHVPHAELQAWYERQRRYYGGMLQRFTDEMRAALPGVIVSRPDAAIYSVIDVRNLVDERWQALEFVLWCASEGRVEVDGRPLTLLTAPMAGFYSVPEGAPNPGRTQMRVAYVETPERMAMVPRLFAELFRRHAAGRARAEQGSQRVAGR